MLKGRAWAGPSPAGLSVGLRSDPPSPDDVFLSPLWEAPESGPILVSLARAENKAGNAARAKEALRRARERFDGALPESADDVVRALGGL